MRIEKLDPDVIDQIAAGEVLERPANMVKEFIENSIDAGATEVDIDVEQGGRYVRIQDNGCGILKEDMSLAFARHATSKIRKSSDLWGLNTFGFRGEALASIASVSKLSIVSCYKTENSAYRLSSEFGKLGEVEESSRDIGTTITVEDLFANVPARLKFLKSDTAEISAIRKVIKAMALTYPNVSFRIKSKSKLLNYWPQSENQIARCQQVLERKKMYLGEAENHFLKCHVIYSAPNETQRNSQNIWFFVKNRWVQDRSLQAAVMAGFEHTLMHGEFPVCAVWIDCDPQDVDVNVHPTKSQVKFRDPRSVFNIVREAIKSSVEKAPWLKDLLPENHYEQESLAEIKVAIAPQNRIQKSTEDLKLKQNLSFGGDDFDKVHFAQKEIFNGENSQQRAMDILKSYAQSPVKQKEKNYSTVIDPLGNIQIKADGPQSLSLAKENEEVSTEKVDMGMQHYWSNLQVLGQANNCYIVAQSRNSLVLVDQHAAHERVAFERIMSGWRGGKLEIQSFLLPLDIEMEEESIEAIIECSEDLIKLGLEVERTGPNTVGVISAPSFLKEKGISHALMELAKEIMQNGGSIALERKISDIAATMACHSVVRAGQVLSLEEMKSLLEQMDDFPLSSFCPHGRPVFVEYNFNKIDKDFGRIV